MRRTLTNPMLCCAVVVMALCAACGGGPEQQQPQEPAATASAGFVLPGEGELPGWSPATEPESYGPDDLWEYINGQADFFIDYGFVRVDAAEYVHDQDSSAVVLEVYEMGRPQEAFGIFAAERTREDRPLEVGSGGFLGSNTLGFWRGTRYVKLMSFDDSPELEGLLTGLAEEIAARLPGEGDQLATLDLFPEEGRVEASERFIPINFLGQPYLTDAYRVDYTVDGEDVQLFIVESESAAEAASRFSQLEAFYLERGDGQVTVEPADASPMLVVDAASKVVAFQLGDRLGGAIAAGSVEAVREGAARLVGGMRGK